jgi:aminobenzoyl-glutamate utilization protein B
MLMDVGVNYLRAPDPRGQDAQCHHQRRPGAEYRAGIAQVWYFVRAPHRDQVEEIYSRVLDIARGAALMSGTTHEIEFITGCYDLLPNKVLSTCSCKKCRKSTT